MQRDNEAVEAARPGDDVGVRVTEYAREHDEVLKVTEDWVAADGAGRGVFR